MFHTRSTKTEAPSTSATNSNTVLIKKVEHSPEKSLLILFKCKLVMENLLPDMRRERSSRRRSRDKISRFNMIRHWRIQKRKLLLDHIKERELIMSLTLKTLRDLISQCMVQKSRTLWACTRIFNAKCNHLIMRLNAIKMLFRLWRMNSMHSKLAQRCPRFLSPQRKEID